MEKKIRIILGTPSSILVIGDLKALDDLIKKLN